MDYKETLIKDVELNKKFKTAGDSIWVRDGEDATVPSEILVERVQVIERTYEDDGDTYHYGLIFHPEAHEEGGCSWHVYTDTGFVKNVMAEVGEFKYADFSEQGMQYTNACHLDVEVA